MLLMLFLVPWTNMISIYTFFRILKGRKKRMRLQNLQSLA